MLLSLHKACELEIHSSTMNLGLFADGFDGAHRFSDFANWVIPEQLLVGRYPYVDSYNVRYARLVCIKRQQASHKTGRGLLASHLPGLAEPYSRETNKHFRICLCSTPCSLSHTLSYNNKCRSPAPFQPVVPMCRSHHEGRRMLQQILKAGITRFLSLLVN